MRNYEEGMTLIETVAALGLLSLCCIVLLPMYIQVTDEQKTMIQERRAVYLLEKEALLLQHHSSGVETGQLEEGTYTWAKSQNGNGTDVCLNWEGDNNRFYEKCLFVLPE
ncbi:type II secretion system protein [Salibacterium salarium]|uniref:Type II secretion system protein n=1 Tax=Salibacterium salarium TaxID=284579 RepID=A0A428MXT0_9BACI|nr:type II secretion system protein [Salibacterium salarium]RSL30944.1 type II secretion system protein [Salibacterium salarium]